MAAPRIEEDLYFCEGCGKVFTTPTGMRVHQSSPNVAMTCHRLPDEERASDTTVYNIHRRVQ